MPNHPSRSKAWFIVVLLLIVTCVVAYVVGGLLARTESAQRVSAAEAQVRSARSQLVVSQSVDRLLRASNSVYRASVALDNRNFGTANNHVAEAIADLNGVDATAVGVDDRKLATLKHDAAGVKINVATNLESQRAALLRLASAIDAIVPPAASLPTAETTPLSSYSQLTNIGIHFTVTMGSLRTGAWDTCTLVLGCRGTRLTLHDHLNRARRFVESGL